MHYMAKSILSCVQYAVNPIFRQTEAVYLNTVKDKSRVEGLKKTCNFNVYYSHVVLLIRKKRGKVFRGRNSMCLELGV